MTTTRSPSRLIAVLAVLLLVVVACGGSDSSDAPAVANGAGADSADDQGSNADTSSDESDNDQAAFGSAPSDIFDATYTKGTAHVEVSGGDDVEVDFAEGGGFTTNGETSLSFGRGDESLLGIAINGDNAGGISFTTTDFASGGAFPEQCRIGVKQNDESGFAGSFECNDVPAVAHSTESKTVDLDGTFSVSR